MYETELLETIADDTDAAKEFLMCLDTQLNKVNQFYKTKEKEFLEIGECLKKQMEILIEVKDAFNQKQANGESTQESKEDDSLSCTISSGNKNIQILHYKYLKVHWLIVYISRSGLLSLLIVYISCRGRLYKKQNRGNTTSRILLRGSGQQWGTSIEISEIRRINQNQQRGLEAEEIFW